MTIDAPTEVVWATLTDFSTYDAWSHYVSEWSGDMSVGGSMKIVVEADKRRTFHPVITELVPERRLRYVHRVFGGLILKADHEITLEPRGSGSCQFQQRETLSGLALPFAWKAISTSAKAGFEQMNDDLKKEAERRFRDSA